MNTVQPIREKAQIDGIKKILLGQNLRDFVIFIFGVNSGMRISDILKLRIQDIADEKYKPKFRFSLRERKTDKEKIFRFNRPIQEAIILYFKELKNRRAPDESAFLGNRGTPLTRQYYWTVLKEVAPQVGIKDEIGCHTMRKSFGYHAFRAGVDIGMLQMIFNHSSTNITKRYIGVTQDEIDNVYMEMEL
jgi:site-specific recombinase XerD